MAVPEKASRTLRPSAASYLAFCGVWFALAGSYGYLALNRPGGGFGLVATGVGAVALAAVLWISGHRVRIGDGQLHYRSGFFQSRSIRLADIESIVNTWERLNILGREIKIPRVTVNARNQIQSFQINLKPFPRYALKELQALVRSSRASSDL
jgi:hypothetical protein